MNIRTTTRLEPVDSIHIIDSYRHHSQEFTSEEHSSQDKDKQSKERQLYNQIIMENSVLTDVGQHINTYI